MLPAFAVAAVKPFITAYGTVHPLVKSSGAVNCTLKVITGSGATVGAKTVGVTKDQTVSHICWGQPLLSRAGKVYISGSHSPYFNE